MNNWKQLRRELRDTFGKNGFKYFNDKNKYTRRIKIYGSNKYVVREYLNTKYPNLTTWEVKGYGCNNGCFGGVCFNMNH